MSNTFRVAQQRPLRHSVDGELYGSEKWYVGNACSTPGGDRYLSNDGRVFPYMQCGILDCNGGTYHLTQQDAQASLDRYLQKVSHASQNTDDAGNTKEVTDQAHILQE